MKRIILCALVCVCAGRGPLFAQNSASFPGTSSGSGNASPGTGSTPPRTEETPPGTGGIPARADLSGVDVLRRNTLLALSSPDYRVTAGDVYLLTYAAGGMAVSYPITVDSTYRIRVSNLGVINAGGTTFRQLKAEAEAVVSNNYPLGGAQLVLTQPALFKVGISGEVFAAQERSAWALDRLSNILEGILTDYASLRDVTVTPEGGQPRNYDLFKALREGDLSQDPYVRPGDRIRVNRIDRVVSVSGAVERPGEYQLLPGEEIGELVSYYANGLTPLADTSRIELTRHVKTETDSGDKYYLEGRDIEAGFVLHHLDAVYIPQITDLIPVMFVEGAVRPVEEDTAEEQPNVSNRITVRFTAGENYSSLVQRNREWFSAVSDTQNAYILRGEERILINLNPMLYDSRYRSQYFVRANDILVVPFRQYFVTVSGAVAVPGRYPYIPDRGWDYYIALAGGFIPDRNSRERVDIVDIAGNKLTKEDVITPETVITARTNAGLYYFNKYAPIITTILSIISTTVTLTLALSR
jgi:protein involved in polysaccharide export with SLBB domain